MVDLGYFSRAYSASKTLGGYYHLQMQDIRHTYNGSKDYETVVYMIRDLIVMLNKGGTRDLEASRPPLEPYNPNMVRKMASPQVKQAVRPILDCLPDAEGYVPDDLEEVVQQNFSGAYAALKEMLEDAGVAFDGSHEKDGKRYAFEGTSMPGRA